MGDLLDDSDLPEEFRRREGESVADYFRRALVMAREAVAPREEAAHDAGAVGSGVEPVAWLIRGKDGLRSTTDRSALESWRGYRTITPLVPADAIASLEAHVAALKESLRVAGEALRRIRDDDEQRSHPCEPKKYGYFGTIASRALAPAETGLKREPDADA